MRVNILCYLVLLLLCPASAAMAIDVDSDGLSDPAAVSIEDDNELSWEAERSSANYGTSVNLSNFGEVGNHIAVGDWEGSSATQFGVVSTNDSNQVVWTVRTSQGNESFILGDRVDTVVSGGDFDGNGVNDALIVNNIDQKKKLVLELLRDPLGANPNNGAPITRQFGRSYDHFSFLDSDADGADEFCYFEALLKSGIYTGKFKLKCFNPVNGGLVTQTNFGKLTGRPQPLARAANQSDLLLFSKNSGSDQTITIRTISGANVSKFTIAKGTLVLGNFVGDAAEEIALEDDGSLSVYSSTGSLLTTLNSPGAIAIDLVNVNDFTVKGRQRLTTAIVKGKAKGSVGKVGAGGSQPGSGGGNGTGCDVVRDPTDGADGFLWKPISDSTGKLAVLLPPGETPSKLTVEFSQTVIQELSFGGLTNGNRPTYRSPDKKGGDFSDGSKVVALYGTLRHCWTIDDTSERTD